MTGGELRAASAFGEGAPLLEIYCLISRAILCEEVVRRLYR